MMALAKEGGALLHVVVGIKGRLEVVVGHGGDDDGDGSCEGVMEFERWVSDTTTGVCWGV